MANQLAYESDVLGKADKFSSERLVDIGKRYDDISRRMDNAPLSKAPEGGFEVTRGMKAEYKDKFGRLQSNRADELMKINEGGTYSNHRLSQPGEGALYTTMEPNAKGVIINELRAAAGEPVIFQTIKVSPERVLDLRDPNVLDHLGVTAEQITGNIYEYNQVIGSTARKAGADAVIIPSAKADGVNLVLFKEP